MAENKIELKSVRELLGMKFFIPNYQRGYRWTEQQVLDLLNDIRDFSYIKRKDYEYYCLQPLVVRTMAEKDKMLNDLDLNETWYEVIDGQQRFTTLYMILTALKPTIKALRLPTALFELRYQRKTDTFNGTKFLQDIGQLNGIENSHIDYYHMSTAYSTIMKWLEDSESDDCRKPVNVRDFCNALLKYQLDDDPKKPRDKAKNVRFIWYESVGEDPIKVFTRLNIGKISLTNAELIKALFLNRSNFHVSNDNHLKLRQQEIASEWDNIEYTLQNDEFWLFLHEDCYDRPTRIDFIFDLICEQKVLGEFGNIGTDEYKTFRYFYEYFKSKSSDIENCWRIVKSYSQTFKEWFNDVELYHYIGYLIHQGEKLDELCKKWNEEKSKEDFIAKLKVIIKDKIRKCNDLNKQYEIDGGPAKTTCKPLLLLHNIQTVVNQNNQLKSKEEYKLPVFYKFPFHLFKKENWDVEHIDSNTTNGLEKEKDQKEWLKYSVLGAELSDDLKDRIKAFINNDNGRESFESICREIEKYNRSESWQNPEQDKNKVWNFVLLDAGTNRGYGNSLFPAKRRCIIGKDQGKSYSIDEGTLEITVKDGAIAFIPPVTKNVFLKYYNTSVDNLREWSESDAASYRINILETLREFDVIDSSNLQNEE